MRTNGHVSYLKISSRFQFNFILSLSTIIIVAISVLASTTIMSLSLANERDALSQHADNLRDSQKRIERYKDSVSDFAHELAKRQQKLENLVQKRFGKLDKDEQSFLPDQKKLQKLPPEAQVLLLAEQKQLALIAALTQSVDERTILAEKALSKGGKHFGSQRSSLAVGGPFIPMNKNLDPLDELKYSFKRYDSAYTLVNAVPSKLPAKPYNLTSNYGIRIDPFNRRRAMHAGLDISGNRGQTIYAAAPGRVVFVGRQGGYGNLVVISHSHGIETRYGHLYKTIVKTGTHVTAGQAIALMGSTGRSTGTHLHFELRINGKATDPLPYLKNASEINKVRLAMR